MKRMKNKVRLSDYEKRIEKALKRGGYLRVPNLGKTKNLFAEAVKNYREMSGTKRITIRVNAEDLIKVKAKAKKNSIPYQTLLNALIRQFAEGRTLVQI